MARCKFLCDHTSNVSWIHSNSNNQLCWKIQTPRTPLRETQGGNKTKMGPDNLAWWGIHVQSSHSLGKGENLMGKNPPLKREKHTCWPQCIVQTNDSQEWVLTIQKTSYAWKNLDTWKKGRWEKTKLKVYHTKFRSTWRRNVSTLCARPLKKSKNS